MTYLLHLVECRLIYAKFLKIILRSLDDLFDDLLVDIALMLQSARLPLHSIVSHARMLSATNHDLIRHGDRLALVLSI